MNNKSETAVMGRPQIEFTAAEKRRIIRLREKGVPRSHIAKSMNTSFARINRLLVGEAPELIPSLTYDNNTRMTAVAAGDSLAERFPQASQRVHSSSALQANQVSWSSHKTLTVQCLGSYKGQCEQLIDVKAMVIGRGMGRCKSCRLTQLQNPDAPKRAPGSGSLKQFVPSEVEQILKYHADGLVTYKIAALMHTGVPRIERCLAAEGLEPHAAAGRKAKSLQECNPVAAARIRPNSPHSASEVAPWDSKNVLVTCKGNALGQCSNTVLIRVQSLDRGLGKCRACKTLDHLEPRRLIVEKQAAAIAEDYEAGANIAQLVSKYCGDYRIIGEAIRSQGVQMRSPGRPKK